MTVKPATNDRKCGSFTKKPIANKATLHQGIRTYSTPILPPAREVHKVIDETKSSRLINRYIRDTPINLNIATDFLCKDVNGVPTTLRR